VTKTMKFTPNNALTIHIHNLPKNISTHNCKNSM
jgi:hypothetical protein